jgi:hypothetical protein
LLTNLVSRRYPLDTICPAYKWRWQAELLFKEWKSYAKDIVGLYAALAAAIMYLVCHAQGAHPARD